MGQLFSRRKIQVTDISSDDAIIVIIGPSGVGKSTFINTAADQQFLKVNNGLKPCTTKVAHVRCTIQFEGSLKPVVFVDTPAFDSDDMFAGFDVETKIRKWSQSTFGKYIEITGIIYLYRITDNRMTQPPYQIFQKLCGERYHARVLLVTTMWEKMLSNQTQVDEEKREKREGFLKEHWSEMIAKGSAVVRHYGTKESAWDAVKVLVGQRII